MKTISIIDPQEIEAVIRSCPYCMVGITDKEGHPYVLPMNFAYEEGTVYLHSGPDGSKVRMVREQPDVCITCCTGHDLVWRRQQVACADSRKSRSGICRADFRKDSRNPYKSRWYDTIGKRTFNAISETVRNAGFAI